MRRLTRGKRTEEAVEMLWMSQHLQCFARTVKIWEMLPFAGVGN